MIHSSCFICPPHCASTQIIFGRRCLLIFGFITVFPWLFKGKQATKIKIDHYGCNGCTKCAEDCPYNAIVMLPRTDGRPHKLVALENPNLCVSCGICLGACDPMVIDFTDLKTTDYYRSLLTRIRAAKTKAGAPIPIVYTCERHATHGANIYISGGAVTQVEVITVPCIGDLHVNVIGQSLDAGASEVKIIGCPSGDCAQREGNLWIEARFKTARAHHASNVITSASRSTRCSLHRMNLLPRSRRRLNRRSGARADSVNFLRGGLAIAIVLAVQVFFTDIPYQPYAVNESLLELGLRNNGEMRQTKKQLTAMELAQLSHDEQVNYLNEQQAAGRYPTRLRLEIDGKVVLEETYAPLGLRSEGSSYAYGKFLVEPGEHAIKLKLDDSGGELKLCWIKS